MGGRGRKGDRTDRIVRVSPRMARRQIRVRNSGGDAEVLDRSHLTDRLEKPLGSCTGDRTKTDTGG